MKRNLFYIILIFFLSKTQLGPWFRGTFVLFINFIVLSCLHHFLFFDLGVQSHWWNKHFTTAITSFYWKAHRMPCFKHLRVSVSAFFFRRVIFLCSMPACFFLLSFLADKALSFSSGIISVYLSTILYYTTEDKVFTILL